MSGDRGGRVGGWFAVRSAVTSLQIGRGEIRGCWVKRERTRLVVLEPCESAFPANFFSSLFGREGAWFGPTVGLPSAFKLGHRSLMLCGPDSSKGGGAI